MSLFDDWWNEINAQIIRDLGVSSRASVPTADVFSGSKFLRALAAEIGYSPHQSMLAVSSVKRRRAEAQSAREAHRRIHERYLEVARQRDELDRFLESA